MSIGAALNLNCPACQCDMCIEHDEEHRILVQEHDEEKRGRAHFDVSQDQALRRVRRRRGGGTPHVFVAQQ